MSFNDTLNSNVSRYAVPEGMPKPLWYAARYFAFLAALMVLSIPLYLVVSHTSMRSKFPPMPWSEYVSSIAILVGAFGVNKLLLTPERRLIGVVLGLTLTVSPVISLIRGGATLSSVFGTLGFVLTLAAATTLRRSGLSASSAAAG